LSGEYYRDILQVIFEGIGRCSIPLEELYFKETIEGEYPLIREHDYQFMCNITVKLSQKSNLLLEAANNKLNIMNI
jgi:hypothetical protein